MTSTEKLLMALVQADAPQWMIDKAKSEAYNDYKSESATPIIDLVRDCLTEALKGGSNAAGLTRVSDQAKDGEFDATLEEFEAWAKRMMEDPEMAPLLTNLGLGPKEP